MEDEFGNIKNKSDFEKLQIAKLHIKKLLQENGVLQSERDELIYELDKLKNGKITTDEKLSFREKKYIEELKNHLNNSKKNNKKLKKQYKHLFDKYMSLQRLQNPSISLLKTELEPITLEWNE